MYIGLCLLKRLVLNNGLRFFYYSLSVGSKKFSAKGKSALDKQIVWPRPPICPAFVTYKEFFSASSSAYVNCLHAQWKLPKLFLSQVFFLLIQLITTVLEIFGFGAIYWIQGTLNEPIISQ